MRLHLTLKQGEHGPYLAGQNHDKIAARSIITVRRCDRHADCWLLNIIQPEKPSKAKGDITVFSPSVDDANAAARRTG